MNKDNEKDWGCAGSIQDSLTDLLRSGARALIQQAVEAELQVFLTDYRHVTDLKGRQTVVRNGYLPERDIVTGVGNVAVKIPKVRDRFGGGKFSIRCWTIFAQLTRLGLLRTMPIIFPATSEFACFGKIRINGQACLY